MASLGSSYKVAWTGGQLQTCSGVDLQLIIIHRDTWDVGPSLLIGGILRNP